MKYTLLIAALILSGCVTSGPVRQAGDMAIQANKANEMAVNQVIDAYTIELKSKSREGYAKEFQQVETVLQQRAMSQYGAPGVVSLADYKKYAAAYAAEMEKSDAYYDSRAEIFKTKLGLQFATERNLQQSVQLYNEASGVPAEDFDALLSGISEITATVIEADRAKAARDEAKPDFDDIFNILGGKLYTYGMEQANQFDPNAAVDAWRMRSTQRRNNFWEIMRGGVPTMAAPKPTAEPEPDPEPEE